MGALGHQLWPVSQVTTLAIVTSRLKPHVYIPRSCSGSAGSCPFTSTPTNDLGAKHDVITPIWLGTRWRTGKWAGVSCPCLPRQGHSNKGHDLPLSATDLWDYWVISRHLGQTVETAVGAPSLSCIKIIKRLTRKRPLLNIHHKYIFRAKECGKQTSNTTPCYTVYGKPQPCHISLGRYQWLHQRMGRERSVTNPCCFGYDKHHLSLRVLLAH